MRLPVLGLLVVLGGVAKAQDAAMVSKRRASRADVAVCHASFMSWRAREGGREGSRWRNRRERRWVDITSYAGCDGLVGC